MIFRISFKISHEELKNINIEPNQGLLELIFISRIVKRFSTFLVVFAFRIYFTNFRISYNTKNIFRISYVYSYISLFNKK